MCTLSVNSRHHLLYNLGVQMLHDCRPLLAFDCLIESVQVYQSNPRLWLRLAECCVLAHQMVSGKKLLLFKMHFPEITDLIVTFKVFQFPLFHCISDTAFLKLFSYALSFIVPLRPSITIIGTRCFIPIVHFWWEKCQS